MGEQGRGVLLGVEGLEVLFEVGLQGRVVLLEFGQEGQEGEEGPEVTLVLQEDVAVVGLGSGQVVLSSYGVGSLE